MLQMHFSPAKTEQKQEPKAHVLSKRNWSRLCVFKTSFLLQFNSTALLITELFPLVLFDRSLYRIHSHKGQRGGEPICHVSLMLDSQQPITQVESRQRSLCFNHVVWRCYLSVRLDSFHKVETERIGQINVCWLKLKWLLYLFFWILNQTDY